MSTLPTIEIKRKELELKRVAYYRDEMLFKLEELEADKERVRSNIVVQDAKIKELTAELSKLKGE